MVSAAGITVSVIAAVLSVIIVCLLFYRFYFLRRPRRNIPKDNTICSPADGKIVKILKIGDKKDPKIKKGLLGHVKLLTKDTIRKGYVIVIMMTPFNVHYQRSPIKGTIINTKHSDGKFLNAVKDASSLSALENEKNEIIISNKDIGKIKVVQVAGFLARRIRCFVESGQKVHKGEEIGLICLGSQVILVIPELKIEVKEGQKVVDGETVIAKFQRGRKR